MKNLMLITVIVMLATFASATGQMMRGMGGGFGKSGKMTSNLPGYQFYETNKEELNLEDSQLKQLKALNDKFLSDRIDMRANIQRAGLELKKEMENASINKTEALKKQEKAMNMRNAMQKRALSYKIDLNNVLTEDQRAKIGEVRKNCVKKGIGMRRGGSGMKGEGSGECYGSGYGRRWKR